MSYRLLYTKSARDDIEKLDSVVKKRIGKKIKSYESNPMLFAKKLTDLSIGSYRWRIGHYRVVFDVYQKDIVILRIGHRKEIYKK